MDRILYEEILKFAGEHHHFPAPENNQEPMMNWDRSYTRDYTELLIEVQHRFLYRLDGAAAVGHSTHKRLTDFVRFYLTGAGQLTRFDLYANVCLLFVGYPDLISRFEQLCFMYDGHDETRLQIREWRYYVRQQFLNEITVVIGDCQSTIWTLKQMPSNLTHRNLELIRRHTDSFWVMQNLGTDRARHIVLPPMEDTQNRFYQMHRFVTKYFAAID